MSSELLQPKNEDTPAPNQEVEFALVLSRIIDSVASNPEHMRSTIYELARHKLKEQFGSESAADGGDLSKSLEVAIHGVEAFHRKEGGSTATLISHGKLTSALAAPHHVKQIIEPAFSEIDVQISKPTNPPALKGHGFNRKMWSLLVTFAIAIVVAVVFVAVTLDLRKKDNIAINRPETTPSKEVTGSSQASATATTPTLAPPSTTVPSSFGIYAVSDDKLYPLDLLPGRAPDIRVAISPLITTDSRTTLPNGRVKFIVYRRDSATNASERAEVRVVAKIAKEVSFDKTGKQVATKVDDNWVIRNISVPHRTGPKKDVPDMYEIQSENPDTPLSPGRYALVLKGQTYDFSIAGQVTDPRQCLERLVATNGQFYSECKP